MRFLSFSLSLLLCLGSLPAPAQDKAAPRAPSAEAKPQAPPASSLDNLYERLGKAKDEAEAKGIASLIERRLARSGSDTADLLMSRAGEAAAKKEYPLAVELLDRAIALEPKWAEAWYRRANLFYLLDDPVSSMADLRRVLTIEPRHFGAWAGLGHIFMASEDKARAIEAYRRALKIHPQMTTVQGLVERLAPQVDGQDL